MSSRNRPASQGHRTGTWVRGAFLFLLTGAASIFAPAWPRGHAPPPHAPVHGTPPPPQFPLSSGNVQPWLCVWKGPVRLGAILAWLWLRSSRGRGRSYQGASSGPGSEVPGLLFQPLASSPVPPRPRQSDTALALGGGGLGSPVPAREETCDAKVAPERASARRGKGNRGPARVARTDTGGGRGAPPQPAAGEPGAGRPPQNPRALPRPLSHSSRHGSVLTLLWGLEPQSPHRDSAGPRAGSGRAPTAGAQTEGTPTRG